MKTTEAITALEKESEVYMITDEEFKLRKAALSVVVEAFNPIRLSPVLVACERTIDCPNCGKTNKRKSPDYNDMLCVGQQERPYQCFYCDCIIVSRKDRFLP